MTSTNTPSRTKQHIIVAMHRRTQTTSNFDFASTSKSHECQPLHKSKKWPHGFKILVTSSALATNTRGEAHHRSSPPTSLEEQRVAPTSYNNHNLNLAFKRSIDVAASTPHDVLNIEHWTDNLNRGPSAWEQRSPFGQDKSSKMTPLIRLRHQGGGGGQ